MGVLLPPRRVLLGLVPGERPRRTLARVVTDSRQPLQDSSVIWGRN